MTPAPTLPSAPDIPLHDIKPLMEVPDHSLTLLLLLAAALLVVIAGAGYALWRRFRRRRYDERRETFARLESVDFSDPKAAAYAVTRDGARFAGDSQRCKEAYDALVARLGAYKYKKGVAPVDEETVSYYRIYVGMIDV